MEVASDRTSEERSNQDKVDEEVFKKAYIPRTLNEVTHYERDVDVMSKQTEEKTSESVEDNIMYQTVTGLKKDLSGVQTVPSLLEDSKDNSGSEEDSEEEEESEDGETPQGGHSETMPQDRKENKKLVKEAQREKRKNKVPKHVKKRKDKISKTKKGR